MKKWKQYLQAISPFNNRTDMPDVLFVLKKILAFWLCYITGLCVAEGIAILLHFALGKNIFAGEMLDAQTITLITYYGFGIVAGTALLYWKWIEKKPLSAMGLTGNIGQYLFGVFMGILLLLLSVAAIILTGDMEFCGISGNTDFTMLLLLTGGFVIQGAAEEILCRGIALHALKARTSVRTAVFVSTVLFIIPHLPTLLDAGILYGTIGIVNLALISCIFSLLTIRFGSIWAACGLHSCWNAVLYGVLGLNLSGNTETTTTVFQLRSAGETILNGGSYGIEASILTTAVLGLAVMIMIWKGRNEHHGISS